MDRNFSRCPVCGVLFENHNETLSACPKHRRKLGVNQQGLLDALRRHGSWLDHGYGSGWVWDNQSGTRRLLNSLVKRGLVVKVGQTYFPVKEAK